MKQKAKKVLLIHTGGTIGMNLQGSPNLEKSFTDQLKEHVPNFFKHAEVSIEILSNIDSSDMLPEQWAEISKLIDAKKDSFDAFLVTHGTDTMAFSATALSFMLKGLNKPIIFTGSQKPLEDPRSDAARNLIHSLHIATDGLVNEVCIFFDSYLFRANRTRKSAAMSFEAFSSPNFPPLAHVGVNINYSRYINTQATEYDPSFIFNQNVFSFPIFPGLEISSLQKVLKNYKAVVIQAFGPGDIPSRDDKFLTLIEDLNKEGIHTIITTQASSGGVDLRLYETGRKALKAGAVSSANMTWETAVIKTMFLLGKKLSREEFRAAFVENTCGELDAE